MIDWDANDSNVLINPRMPAEEQLQAKKLTDQFSNLKGHIWVATSGSTASKWAALSKEAILCSAAAVNAHLQSTENDVWINPLPIFHVGGLGIVARSHLSGAKVVVYNAKWDPDAFHHMASATGASLASLVPAQVHDLVSRQLRVPPKLRAVLVGGGSLQESLYYSAKALGWTLLPSYGMTECSSQIATAVLGADSPELKVLPHVEVSVNSEGRIVLKSKALLTGYAIFSSNEVFFTDPKADGSFLTDDLGNLTSGSLQVLGRIGDFFKIGGESVHLSRLENVLEKVKLELGVAFDCALVAVPDARLGHVIHLAAESSDHLLQRMIERFHIQVLPFERIRQVHIIPTFPRTPLGKLKRAQLLNQIVV